jgi:hypothetical protein
MSGLLSLIQLPNEILFRILQFCRPDGFEPFMLTCKEVYAIGASLISRYDICKKSYYKYWHSQYPGERFVSLGVLSTFLHLWAKVPHHSRLDLLSYLQKFHFHDDLAFDYFQDPYPVTKEFRRDEPWLIDGMRKILEEFPGLLPMCKICG